MRSDCKSDQAQASQPIRQSRVMEGAGEKRKTKPIMMTTNVYLPCLRSNPRPPLPLFIPIPWGGVRGGSPLPFLLFLVVSSFFRSAPAVAQSTASVCFTGDILLDRGVRAAIDSAGIDHLFDPQIDALFREATAVVGNLECPATRIHRPMQKFFIFRAEPEWLHDLRRHGFTHLNMANNHTVDQGRMALRDTWLNVKAARLVPVGADSTMAAAAEPVLLCHEPRPVYLFASLRVPLENFAYLPDRFSPNQEPMDSLCARVERLRRQQPDAVIVVSLHWGLEHKLRPHAQQVVEAHRLIDAGASALICHHSHTFQTVGHYKGRPVYYSLGNYIFDPTRPINRRAAIVKMTVGETDLHFDTIPVYIEPCTPRIAPE